MRKIATVLLFIFLCFMIVFSPSKNASAFYEQHELPFIFNGQQYTEVLSYSYNYNNCWWNITFYYLPGVTQYNEITRINHNEEIEPNSVAVSGALGVVYFEQADCYNGGQPNITEYAPGSIYSVSFGVGSGYVPFQKENLYTSRDIMNQSNVDVWFLANVFGSVSAQDDYARRIRRTDIDKDGDIDAKDFSTFLQSFGSSLGFPNFNPAADFDGNGRIDMIDLAIFSSMFGKEDTSLYISDCKYILKNEGIVGERLNSRDDQKCYDFTVNENTTIAILSTGDLDLKGELFELLNGTEIPVDADKDGITDAGDKQISQGFADRDTPPVFYKNFMLRPGAGGDGERRIMPAGHYRVRVSFDDGASFVDDDYGLILLKRGPTQGELIDDFFSGIKALIEDDGGYDDNDYLDIYVQALFPDIYDTNWFSTIDYNGVIAERQCKALPNFFVKYFFGQGEFLYNDCTIDDHLSSNDPDWVLRRLATTIFNDMSVPSFGDVSDAMRGDVWVKDMGLTCLDGNWRSGFNHYGLYFDSGSILDANWSDPTDGKLRISNTRTPNKIVRPEN